MARRLDFFAVIAALSLVAAAWAAPASAQFGRDLDDDEPSSALGVDLGMAPLRYELPSGARFAPRRLALITDRGVRIADLPARAPASREDRVPVGRAAGRFGALFAPRPLPSYLRAHHRLGPAYRVGDVLVADLRGAPTTFDARATVLLLTRGAGQGRDPIGLALDVALRPGDGRGLDGGVPAGDAYWADGRLLISPPYDRFYGFRLWD